MGENSAYGFPNPYTWAVRFRNQMFYRYERLYKTTHDRDGFLANKLQDILFHLFPATLDAYQSSILQIWHRAYFDRQPLSVTLKQIEKCRQEFLQYQYAANEFPSLYGHCEVDDFVEQNDRYEIIRFLITHDVLNYFRSVVIELQNNRKSGGLREVTEAVILLKVKNGERMTTTNYGAQVGLKWTGAKIAERTEALYRYLVQKGFIPKQTKMEDFRNLFADQPVDNRVTWLKMSKQLLLFIEAFLDKEFLFMPNDLVKKRQRSKELSVTKARGEITPEQNSELKGALREVNYWLYPRIAACFKNKKGAPFTTSNLKHARNDLYNKQKYPKASNEFVMLADSIARI